MRFDFFSDSPSKRNMARFWCKLVFKMDFPRLCDLVQISQPSVKKLIESCKQGQANDSLNINTLAKFFFIIHQLLLGLFSLYIRIVLVCILIVFLYTRFLIFFSVLLASTI